MMAQARRKPPAKPKRGKSGGHRTSMTMLLAGMVIGSLATMLWQGVKTADSGIGAGIREMLASVGRPSPAGAPGKTAENPPKPASAPISFDFYGALREIEVPVLPPREAAVNPPAKTQDQTAAKGAEAAGGDSYMLQAGSFRRRAEADQLKANLALNGMVSAIQKVSIQGSGDYYRVRLGPYPTYKAMEEANQQLIRAGIEALRLKLVKAG